MYSYDYVKERWGKKQQLTIEITQDECLDDDESHPPLTLSWRDFWWKNFIHFFFLPLNKKLNGLMLSYCGGNVKATPMGLLVSLHSEFCKNVAITLRQILHLCAISLRGQVKFLLVGLKSCYKVLASNVKTFTAIVNNIYQLEQMTYSLRLQNEL